MMAKSKKAENIAEEAALELSEEVVQESEELKKPKAKKTTKAKWLP